MISPQRSYYSPSLKGDVFAWIPNEREDRPTLMKEIFLELRKFLRGNNEICRNDWRILSMEDVATLIKTNEIASWITGPIVLPPEGNSVRVISRPKVAHLWCDGKTDIEQEWKSGYQILIFKKVH